MFRSSAISRELALNMAKVLFVLKHSAKLLRYLLCGCVAACHGMACVLYAVQDATSSPFGHVGGRSLLRYYDLYQSLQLQFYVLLMMGAMDTRNM